MHSLKSLIVKTIPGPLVKVSTSVPLFLNFVMNFYISATFVTISRWLF